MHKIAIIGDSILARLLPPGDCKDSGLKHTPSVSVKEAYLFVQEEPWLEGHVSGLAYN